MGFEGFQLKWLDTKSGFMSEETGEFFSCQNEYSKSLSWAEILKFPPKTVNNLFKLSAQDGDLEYLFWQRKILQNLLTQSHL